jgi:hypothetical protein
VRWEDEESGRGGDEERGRWEDEETGRESHGEMGRLGEFLFLCSPFFLLPSSLFLTSVTSVTSVTSSESESVAELPSD